MIRWFSSRTVRHATAMRKHVGKILAHQRDILSAKAIQEVEGAMVGVQEAIDGKAAKPEVEKRADQLEKAANKWLKPYPNPAWRENVEVLLVALAVAMAVRTFFLQPFRIPTGSMQPTLYGVTSIPDYSPEPRAAPEKAGVADIEIPRGWRRVQEWFQGVSYVQVKAKVDGRLESVSQPVSILIFNLVQSLKIGGQTHWILFPPDYGSSSLQDRAGLRPGTAYQAGEEVVRMKMVSGDHLFVNRVSYNFRTPDRGEIIVFETKGIHGVPPGQFYIKRLVGLGGERLALSEDYTVHGAPRFGTVPIGHLVVDGKHLSASTPHFENLYSIPAPRGATDLQYEDQRYYEHGMLGGLAPGEEYQVPPNHLFVLGDNTMNSHDSRMWGGFSSTNLIGKSFFVYWPITKRFGWGQR